MCPDRTVAVAFTVLLALSSVAAAPLADARRGPTPVCGVCAFNETAPDGTDISTGNSTLTVLLHENGSATWKARVELTSGRDALAENESLRRVIVGDAAGSIAKPRKIHSRIEGDTLIVTYHTPTAAKSHAGAVVFTPLTSESPLLPFVIGGEGARYLITDRLTLRAPPGYELRGDAPTEKNRSLVWIGNGGRTDIDVNKDPVAIEENTMMADFRVWLARLLA